MLLGLPFLYTASATSEGKMIVLCIIFVCVFVCHTVWLCEQSRKNVTECAVLQLLLLLRLFG